MNLCPGASLFLFIIGVFLDNDIVAQCYDRSQWMDSVYSIEDSETDNAAKISRFSLLNNRYTECNPTPDSITARITHRLGDLYRLEGNIEKGIALTRRAVAINKQKGFPIQTSFLTNSYYNLGLYHQLLGLFREAQLYFDSCIAVGVRYPNKAFIVQMAFERKAFLYFKAGDYANSVATADRGIFMANRVGDPVREALLLLQRAQAKVEMDLTQEADDDANSALRLLRENNADEFLPNAYSVQANILSRRNQFDDAIKLYTMAYQLNAEVENWEQCVRDLQDLGYLYDNAMSDSKKALAFYVKAMRYADKTSDQYTRATLFNNIAMVHFREGQFLRSLQKIQEGMLTVSVGNINNGRFSNPDSAQLAQVTNDYVVMTLVANKAETELHLFRTSKNKTWLNESLSTFLLLDVVIDQMRWRQNEEQSRILWRERTRKWYALAIEVCHLLKDSKHGFYFFEKSRSVLLNDRLNELSASSRLSPLDSTAENNLRVQLLSTQQRLTGLHPNTVEYGRIKQQIFENQQSLDGFIRQIEKKYPLYYQYRYNRSIANLDNVRAKLSQEGKSLISFFNHDKVIYAVVIRPDTVFLQRIEYPVYRNEFAQYMELLSSPAKLNKEFRRFRELSHSIYSKIIEPFSFTTEGLVVVHDDMFFPLESLVQNADNTPRYYIQDMVMSYSYSVSFIYGKEQEPSSAARVLAIAPVEFAPSLSLSALRGSDKAVREMRKYSSAVTYLTGSHATRKGFTTRSGEYDIVHLLTHADRQFQDEPVLFFRDSILKVSDLQMFGWSKTRLISLFACHTGTGRTIAGEGTFSLARGFAAAGIPSTITTLWALDDQSTYKLADFFYRNVYAGMSTDKALQQAKLKLMESDAAYTLPYYWAGTVMVGPSQEFNFDDKSGPFAAYFSLVVIAGIVIAILSLIFFIKRNARKKNTSATRIDR